MTMLPVYPVAIIIIIALGIAYMISWKSEFFRKQLTTSATVDRLPSLDGVRGYCALGVFLHHAVITFYYFQTGRWEIPPSRLATLLGQGGVALFFCMTGFLFWTKVLAQSGQMDARSFFKARVLRIAPMYWAALLLQLVVIFSYGGTEIKVSFVDLFAQIATWVFFFANGRPINAFGDTWMINSAVWTLAYEWLFYLFLPFLTMFASRRGTVILVLMGTICLAVVPARGFEWYFVVGVAAAALNFYVSKFRALCRSWGGSLVILASSIFLYAVFDTAYTPGAVLVLFFGFTMLAGGNNMFGFLIWPPVRLLGLISYSLYLLHSIFLYGVFHGLPVDIRTNLLTPFNYWMTIGVMTVALIMLSSLTYQRIEWPFLARRVSSGLPVTLHGKGVSRAFATQRTAS